MRKADKYSKFVERTARLYGISISDVFDMMDAPSRHTGRINRLKVYSRDEFEAAATEVNLDYSSLEWYPDGFVFEKNKGLLAETPLITEGKAFIQNASSFIPVLALQPQENEDILDVCAAPGGKSSMIAALTGNRAGLWLNDGIPARIKKLKDVQRILDFEITSLTTHQAQYIDKYIDHAFDRILLNAQCSGEGMIDLARPGSLKFWSMDRVIKYSRLQTKMLTSCFKLLKPGGTLVYSTCTLAPEENESPVSTLLKRCDDAVIEPVILDIPAAMRGVTQWEKEKYDASIAGALRIIPDDHMEGFFACRIRKLGNGLTRKNVESIDIAREGAKRSLP